MAPWLTPTKYAAMFLENAGLPQWAALHRYCSFVHSCQVSGEKRHGEPSTTFPQRKETRDLESVRIASQAFGRNVRSRLEIIDHHNTQVPPAQSVPLTTAVSETSKAA